MSTSLKSALQADLKSAMIARDKQSVDTLRLIMAAVKQVEVDERIIVDDVRLIVILDKMAKQRLESLTHFEAAGRADLIEKETFELNIIKKYLPEQLSPEEIKEIISAAFAEVQPTQMSDMGKVMAIVKPKMQGRADISQVSALVKEKLNSL